MRRPPRGARPDRAAVQAESTSDDEPQRLHAEGLAQTRTGPVGLLRDLQDLYLLVSFVEMTWTVVRQAAQALRDGELLDVTQRTAQRRQPSKRNGAALA